MKLLQVFLALFGCVLLSSVHAFISNDYAAADAAKVARVVNGQETEPGRYPQQAFLQIRTLLGVGQCGGTLVSPSVVLTAAHCLATLARSVTVILGCDDVGVITDECEVFENQKTFFMSPNYVNAIYGFDYAVIILDTPSTHTPVSLPSKEFQFIEGLPLTVAGYGKVEYDEPTSDRLLEAQLFSVAPEKCEEQYNKVDEIQSGGRNQGIIQGEHMICAMGNDASACMGDSGGPLFVKCDGGDVQFGVVSFGFACVASDIPSVYSNLLNDVAIDFIQGHVESKGESLKFVSDLADVCSPEPEIEVQDMTMVDPEAWTCAGRKFATGDKCDCGCGIRDPDCDWDTSVECADAELRTAEDGTTPYKVAVSLLTMLGAAGSVIGFLLGRLEKRKLQAKAKEDENAIQHFLKA